MRAERRQRGGAEVGAGEAAALPELELAASVITVEVDEMWHFLKKFCQAVGLACL